MKSSEELRNIFLILSGNKRGRVGRNYFSHYFLVMRATSECKIEARSQVGNWNHFILTNDYWQKPSRTFVDILLRCYTRSSRPKVFCKKLLLKILQSSQENTCAGVFLECSLFLLQLPTTLLKKRLRYMCFPVNFATHAFFL